MSIIVPLARALSVFSGAREPNGVVCHGEMICREVTVGELVRGKSGVQVWEKLTSDCTAFLLRCGPVSGISVRHGWSRGGVGSPETDGCAGHNLRFFASAADRLKVRGPKGIAS